MVRLLGPGGLEPLASPAFWSVGAQSMPRVYPTRDAAEPNGDSALLAGYRRPITFKESQQGRQWEQEPEEQHIQ